MCVFGIKYGVECGASLHYLAINGRIDGKLMTLGVGHPSKQKASESRVQSESPVTVGRTAGLYLSDYGNARGFSNE